MSPAQPYLLVCADVLDGLRALPDESVHCVVTSPPYWNLRDYKTEGQIGLEATPELYVERVVGIFREVRRVLRKDGTLWLNIGDKYVQQGKGGQGRTGQRAGRRHTQETLGKRPENLKPKDMVGIPWRLALALQADGWYLRQDNIWLKKNGPPESAADRPTKSHEYVFLFSKSKRYFYDFFAVLEPASGGAHSRGSKRVNPKAGVDYGSVRPKQNPSWSSAIGSGGVLLMRNLRSVWPIAVQPYKGAHYAAFPEALASICVRAGSSEHGCCSECGSPYTRLVAKPHLGDWHPDPELKAEGVRRNMRHSKWAEEEVAGEKSHNLTRSTKRYRQATGNHDNYFPQPRHLGWKQGCSCSEHELTPAIVLDPFCGTGTTGVVSLRFGRRFIGIDNKFDYLRDCARPRIENNWHRVPRVVRSRRTRLGQMSFISEAS